MKKIRRYLFSGPFFVLFLIANPAYFLACDENEAFTYGEAEMLSLVEEVNTLDFEVAGYEVSFTLSQKGEEMARRWLSRPELIATARACSSRSFVKSASACEDTSSMPLSGTTTISRINEDDTVEVIATLPTDGFMTASGLDLRYAEFDLALPNGDAYVTWRESEQEGFSLQSFIANNIDDSGLSVSNQQ